MEEVAEEIAVGIILGIIFGFVFGGAGGTHIWESRFGIAFGIATLRAYSILCTARFFSPAAAGYRSIL